MGIVLTWGTMLAWVSIFRCSCPIRDSSLLPIHHRCLSSISVRLWVVCPFYPISLMVILVFSLIAPDCLCVRVYMSSFLGLRSAFVALCAALLFL